MGRIKSLTRHLRPDVIIIQNDPWNFGEYLDKIEDQRPFCKVLGAVAVDGKNCRVDALNRMDGCVFWTQFALDEARKCGFTKPGVVIPLGVDRTVYKPMDQLAARRTLEIPEDKVPVGSFIVGNVNRNQPRKRLDLTIRYFCEWVKSRDINDAFLYLHVAPTGDRGWDVRQLMEYYGVKDRLILVIPSIGQGVSEADLALSYNCFDVMVSTTQGEGFGLTTLEGMASGIPQILPDWSALGDWARDGAYMVPCTTTATTANFINVVGGIADEAGFLSALDTMYFQKQAREELADSAYQLACEPRFNWTDIAGRFEEFTSTQVNDTETALPAHRSMAIGAVGGS
jgi:glycosyltransferase involved in cell wall biosynthesis